MALELKEVNKSVLSEHLSRLRFDNADVQRLVLGLGNTFSEFSAHEIQTGTVKERQIPLESTIFIAKSPGEEALLKFRTTSADGLILPDSYASLYFARASLNDNSFRIDRNSDIGAMHIYRNGNVAIDLSKYGLYLRNYDDPQFARWATTFVPQLIGIAI